MHELYKKTNRHIEKKKQSEHEHTQGKKIQDTLGHVLYPPRRDRGREGAGTPRRLMRGTDRGRLFGDATPRGNHHPPHLPPTPSPLSLSSFSLSLSSFFFFFFFFLI